MAKDEPKLDIPLDKKSTAWQDCSCRKYKSIIRAGLAHRAIRQKAKLSLALNDYIKEPMSSLKGSFCFVRL